MAAYQSALGVNQLAGGASFQNANTVTPSDSTVVNAAALWVNCTVAGNLVLVMAGGQTVTVPVPTGINTLPFAAAIVKTTGMTATASIIALS